VGHSLYIPEKAEWMMGALCSTVDKEGDEPCPPHKMPQKGVPLLTQTWQASISNPKISTEAEYFQARAALIQAEKATAFDAGVIAKASDIEKRATKIVQGIRNHDWDTTYNLPPSHRRAGGLDENNNIIVKRTAGEHFLTNVDLINQTELLKVARKMPKGAHLHVHFNSCLSPKILIQQARDLPTMWIASSHPLTKCANFCCCRIQFNVFTDAAAAAANTAMDAKEKKISTESNIFSPNYASMRWMKYKDFQEKFNWRDDTNGTHYQGVDMVEAWLEKKMLFSEDEVHGVRQTSRGYVTCATRCM
jgi:adenosine deaminase CECR1